MRFLWTGGASVFTTNLLLIHLSSQTCFDNLSLLSFVVPTPSPNYLFACFVDPSQGVQSYNDNPVGGSWFDDAM